MARMIQTAGPVGYSRTPGPPTESMDDDPKLISKGAQKRLDRQAKADERRERVLLKRQAARERKKLQRKKTRPQVMMSDPGASPVRVALDLSFDSIMADHPKDIAKLAKQIERCYGDNRRAARPLQLHITSLTENSSEENRWVRDVCNTQPSASRTASHLQARSGFSTWDVHRHEEHWFELWPSDEIVYLCAESDTVLKTLEPSKTYVIGGLVDHNRCKGLTHGIAQGAGVSTARLPITEHISLQCGTMLAVNHVFKILLEFEQQPASLSNDARWSIALDMVIPQRKRKPWVPNQWTSRHNHHSGVDHEGLLPSAQNDSNAICSISAGIAVVMAATCGGWWLLFGSRGQRSARLPISHPSS